MELGFVAGLLPRSLARGPRHADDVRSAVVFGRLKVPCSRPRAHLGFRAAVARQHEAGSGGVLLPPGVFRSFSQLEREAAAVHRQLSRSQNHQRVHDSPARSVCPTRSPSRALPLAS